MLVFSFAMGLATMGSSQERLPAWQRLATATVFAVHLRGSPVGAWADIIIDDFDDPVQIDLPEMKDDPQITEGVGELGATRTITVGHLGTDPIGSVDADITKASHLSTRIDGQTPASPQSNPILGFGIGYLFDGPTDLTEGGINDALFIDMEVFQGSGNPNSFLVVGHSETGGFVAGGSRISLLSDTPYTIALSFPFGPRGGGEPADLSTVEQLGIRIRLLQGSRDPDTNWFVQIDRIRVGRIVPEPSFWQVGIMGTLVLLAGTARRRVARFFF